MRRLTAALAAAIAIGGCAGAGGATATSTTQTPEPAREGSPLPASLAAGRQVVESTCLTCHSLRPPHKTAPPMTMIATRYAAAEPDTAAAARRIAAWARDPDPARSVLPPHAIERFGLMPPLDLPEADLRNAASYILTLRETAAGGMGGMGGGAGRMGAGHGQHRP